MTRIKDIENRNPEELNPSDLLLYHIHRCKRLRKEQAEKEVGKLSHQDLSAWQSERLARTHADLLQSPRYRQAAEFFLDDLYGPKDFSRRDHDLERTYPMIITMLPENAIYAVALAMELDGLSMELDTALLQIFSEQLKVTTKDEITEKNYAEGYRRCNNYDKRKHQIELIGILGHDLDLVVAKPLIYTALRMAKIPAHLAGFGELQDFLERGFRAFHHMQGADEFLENINGKEIRILDRIFAQHPEPFNLELPD